MTQPATPAPDGALISVESVSKSFKSYNKPTDRLKEIFLKRQVHSLHHALKNVSLRVHAGEAVGLIGRNGAGKSTLLKLIMGVVLPDAGAIEVSGKTTGLLELGTGFNPQLSGRDNITFNALLLGLTTDEIEARRGDIIAFTEMAEFIDNPLKTYSSGMIMRLAFAIAIHADPRCFIVDEALAVGDAYFQQKCMRHIHDFRESGGAILLVSHDLNSVKSLCDRAVMLEGGEVVMDAEPKTVVDYYEATTLRSLHQGAEGLDIVRSGQGSGVTSTGEVSLESLGFYDDDGNEVGTVVSEMPITVRLTLRTGRMVNAPHYGFALRDRYGRSIFETNTYCMGLHPTPLTPESPVEVSFRFICNIVPGDYSLSIGVSNEGVGQGAFKEYLLLIHEAAMLHVYVNEAAITYAGVTNLNPLCTINPTQPSTIERAGNLA